MRLRWLECTPLARLGAADGEDVGEVAAKTQLHIEGDRDLIEVVDLNCLRHVFPERDDAADAQPLFRENAAVWELKPWIRQLVDRLVACRSVGEQRHPRLALQA